MGKRQIGYKLINWWNKWKIIIIVSNLRFKRKRVKTEIEIKLI